METLYNQVDDSRRWSFTSQQDHVFIFPSEDVPGPVRPLMCLDGAILGDIPARYIIPCVKDHEFPAMGVYIDSRIVPGFRYKVRVLPDPTDLNSEGQYLFQNRALRLDSIGRGYSRRLTFQSDADLNNNDNYFWTDSRPGGFALEIEAVSASDKFLILDSRGITLGELEVMDIMGPQEEISQDLVDNCVKKTVKVQMRCKLSWLDWRIGSSIAKISGTAECIKTKGGGPAKVNHIHFVDLFEGCQPGIVLVPWKEFLQTQILGDRDLSTSYKVCGLKHTEHPVVGTFVSSRVLPGFKYKVRRLPDEDYLFHGKALCLNSVGIGYGKRLSFEPDENCLNDPNNFFWSDSSASGFALQPIAVEAGEILKLTVYGCILGEAMVIQVASLDKEIRTALICNSLEKVFEVDLICRVQLLSGIADTIRVRGLAYISKPKGHARASLVSIRHVAVELTCGIFPDAVKSILSKSDGIELIP